MAVANVDVRVNTSDAVNSLRRLDQASKGSQSALDGLARQAAGIGLALVGGFAIDRVIRDVTALERNIRRLGTVGMDVAKISPALSKLSADLGGVANAADLAAASYQAASAGFSDTAGNIQILNAATKAAVGGLADAEAVTEVLVKTLNAYGMSGSRAFEVTDSISKAVELGNQEWSDYTALLGRVVSTSSLAGVSIDQLNAFIAAATKNGATAEVAFTGLGAVLNTLLQPTKESQDAAAKLGIAWNYSGLQARGFTGLMADLAKAMEKDKETTARLLGSQEAMRGAFAANAKSGKDFVMILEELQKASGKTDADFQTMRGSLENTTKALDTSFQNLSAALVKAFGPTIVITLQDLTKTINGFADAINSVPQPVLNATGELIKFIVQMMLVKKAIEGVIALRAAYVGAMAAMAAATAASGTAATGSASATALYMNNTKALTAQAAVATPIINGLTAAMLRLAGIGIVTIGIQFLVSQVGEITAAARTAGLSEAASTPRALLDQLKGLTKAQLEERRKATAANLANDRKLARELSASIGMQESTAMSSMDAPLPSDRSRLVQINARIAANERRLAAIAQQMRAAPTRTESDAERMQQQLLGQQVGTTDATTQAGTDKAATERERAAKAAAEEQKRVAQVIRERIAETELLDAKFRLADRINAAESDGDQMLAERLRGQQALIDLQYKYAQQIAGEKDIRAQEAIARQGIMEMIGAQAETEYKLNDIQKQRNQDQMNALQALVEKQYEMNTAIQQQIALADSVSASLGKGLTSTFDLLISGADNWAASLQQIASGVLVDIANQLIRIYVIEQAINAIKTFLTPFSYGKTPLGAGGGSVGGKGTFGPNYGFPARATGGSVTAGQPYLVGERGPELFMPGRSGGIAPSGSFGGVGNIVVNVDASGSSVQGDTAQGNRLGQVIGAAVRQELINQKRPGGLLA